MPKFNPEQLLLGELKELARAKISVELAQMLPVMKHLLGKDFIHILIVTAALNPEIPMPSRLYEEMKARGYTPKNRQLNDDEAEEIAKGMTDELLAKIFDKPH